ncbi:HlyD family type I secretion periplasmic adaptor subunit [Photobacterium sanctipauli]|uniref:Membrane fusion protein (MFP) family protein n=1 Tax=Photobacterium sanctipauli TaxID=1342794 RepID=A0A2T3NWW4_9GAMM|nr:HlyD family type I secretion periplasmic adaptor subunit [Photobacterium sanctipauli]PSW20755.1 HlyD family type I secretion periplasmic adaptor subunit [Photobacterium sanctipauli]
MKAKSSVNQKHIDYMDDSSSALLLQAPKGASVLLGVVVAFIALAFIWAANAELEQVTRGQGRVIPSQQLQVVQNLEGGIVKEILIAEGEKVSPQQPLILIDDTRFRSDFDEKAIDLAGLQADALRLGALLESVQTNKQAVTISTDKLTYTDAFATQHTDLVKRQRSEYQDTLANLSNQLSVISQQIQQKNRELDEAKARLANQKRSLSLASQEYRITKPLADEGVVPKVELLKLQRQVNDSRREVTSTEMNMPVLKAELSEAKLKRLDIALKFRADTQAELNQTADKLDTLSQASIGLEDKVTRTTVVSPVNGRVHKLHINTVGGVIQPGMDLIEIVPTESSLLVEAKIAPKDIAFLRPGLKARVKFTAYDFTVYGGLEGILEHISADTLTNEQGDSFYQIRIRTDEPHMLDKDGSQLPIIPGMTAAADIITGHRTVLQYLLNPVLKARHTALRE